MDTTKQVNQKLESLSKPSGRSISAISEVLNITKKVKLPEKDEIYIKEILSEMTFDVLEDKLRKELKLSFVDLLKNNRKSTLYQKWIDTMKISTLKTLKTRWSKVPEAEKQRVQNYKTVNALLQDLTKSDKRKPTFNDTARYTKMQRRDAVINDELREWGVQ